MNILDLAERTDDWDTLRRSFRPEFPLSSNIAVDSVSRHAQTDGGKIAIVFDDRGGDHPVWTYGELEETSNRLAGLLRALGVGRGDRVAIYSGQSPEAVVSHLATFKLGAISATIPTSSGSDALQHILSDSGAVVVVADEELAGRIEPLRANLPALREVLGGSELFQRIAGSKPIDEPVLTMTEEAAILVYTSGSTGPPKGVLHSHRILAAYLPTIICAWNFDLAPDSVVYSPFDWGWMAGLFDVLFPGLALGVTVVAHDGRFSPNGVYKLCERHRVTHFLAVASGLKQMAQIESPKSRYDLKLRVISTGGEKTPPATVEWLERELGVAVIDFYGLSEVNHLIGNCPRFFPVRPGSIGQAYPGHHTAVLGADNLPLPPGQTGEIAARRDAPTLFLGYWNQPELTAQRFRGDWVLTGDVGWQDEDGYFWHLGRTDDLIKSAGVRISPGEIEVVLLAQPAVAEAVVVGWPDEIRGEIVRAYIRLMEGFESSPQLTSELQQSTRERLGAPRVPRQIVYLKEFPVTSNGKIRRSALRHGAIDIEDQSIS